MSARAGAWLRSRTGWRADLASALLGALAAAALPPLFILPALLVAVPGLLALIDASPNALAAARRGFWFGFGHHVLGLYWVTEAILIEAARYWWFVPMAVPGLAAILAPFIALPCAAARLVPPGWRRVLMLGSAWVLADLARQFIGTGFPWNPWGSVWEMPGTAGDVFIQPAAWIGVHGLTYATVLLAATPALGSRALLGAAAALALWAGYGVARLRSPDPPPPGLKVALVQGNVAQGQKLDQLRARAIFERHLALTRDAVAAAGAGPVAVVWPESSSPYALEQEPVAREMIAEAARPAVASLVGTVRFPEGPPRPDGAARPRNSLLALGPEGEIEAVYDKWHLVPGGEYAPDWVPFSVQLVPGGGFAPGPGPRTLHLPGMPPVGVLICYEAIFPAQVVDEADRPAWIVNVTNDAWFGDSSGPRQHLAAARMRAVEEGLPLLRAANTGITAAFDARGREIGRIERAQAGTLTLALPGRLPPTPFSRWGLVTPLLLALGGAGVSLGMVRRRAVRGDERGRRAAIGAGAARDGQSRRADD